MDHVNKASSRSYINLQLEYAAAMTRELAAPTFYTFLPTKCDQKASYRTVTD